MRTENRDRIVVRPMTEDDIPGATHILIASGLCADMDEVPRRLVSLLRLENHLCHIAVRGGEPSGVLLATFNGFHIILSHIDVSQVHHGMGIATRLHREVEAAAVRLGAQGIIADSWLTATGFYYKLGYRLPGAVFLIKRLEGAENMRET
jgi:predicted N-acetyltransferase YhbS